MTNRIRETTQSVADCCLRFLFDRHGVGSVEFAIIAPALVFIYLASAEISIAVTMARKASVVNAVVNDIVSQHEEVTQADLRSIYTLAFPAMSPYPTNTLSLKTTGLRVDKDGDDWVEWSYCVRCGNIPDRKFDLSSIVEHGKSGFVVVTQTSAKYDGWGVVGLDLVLPMDTIAYSVPRMGTKVVCTDCN